MKNQQTLPRMLVITSTKAGFPSLIQWRKIEKRLHLYYTAPMIRKSKHYFNPSGPNKPEKHSTLKREYLIKKR
jgi:hypothetical protein